MANAAVAAANGERRSRQGGSQGDSPSDDLITKGSTDDAINDLAGNYGSLLECRRISFGPMHLLKNSSKLSAS